MIDEDKIVELYKKGNSVEYITQMVKSEENATRENNTDKKTKKPKMTDKQARYIVEKAIVEKYNQIYSS